MATSKEPDATIRAGMQKIARNLAVEELLIEVMADRGRKLFSKTGFDLSGRRNKQEFSYTDVRFR